MARPFQRPEASGLYLTVDEVDGPMPVTVVGGTVPTPPTRRPRAHLRMLAIWAGLVIIVFCCLASDGGMFPDEWAAVALMCMAGWPVTAGISRAAHTSDEVPPADEPEEDTPRRHRAVIVLRRGAVVDAALVKALADLLGLKFIKSQA